MSDLKQHVSDVDTWGGADRNWYVFVVLSVLFGLVGGDHFYLRSFKTGFQKAFLNLLTFGAWHWWDLSQIIWQRDTVLKEGLSSPLDWIRNIGRGVFTTPTSPPLIADKSYVVFALLAVFFGLLGADKFYMGSPIQGLAKLILCFNLFTFLVGWAWVAWDAFHATFMTEDLLKNGIQAPVGLNVVFGPIDSKAFRLHAEREGVLGLAEPYLSAVGLTTDGAIGDWINGFVCAYGSLFGISHSHTEKCVKHTVPAAASAASAPVSAQVKQRGGAVLELKEPVVIQEGGAKTDSSGPNADGGPGPVVAGALAAVVITAGLKGTYDFIKQQYG
jgi:TM2 domain-containing membrane protein YozV